MCQTCRARKQTGIHKSERPEIREWLLVSACRKTAQAAERGGKIFPPLCFLLLTWIIFFNMKQHSQWGFHCLQSQVIQSILPQALVCMNQILRFNSLLSQKIYQVTLAHCSREHKTLDQFKRRVSWYLFALLCSKLASMHSNQSSRILLQPSSIQLSNAAFPVSTNFLLPHPLLLVTGSHNEMRKHVSTAWQQGQ